MSLEAKLLHYRNAHYQGQIKLNKRNGNGILITDKGEIMIGGWKNDKLSGQAMIIYNPFEYCYGEFNRGQFQGWFLFHSNQKILISQFNSDRVINRQLLINKQQGTYRIIIPKNPIYEIIKEGYFDFNQLTVEQLIFSELQVNVAFHSIEQFLQLFLQLNIINNEKKADACFQVQTLSNGYKMFKFHDSSNPLSLGCVFSNKNNQIISYGTYVNNKLTGYGCKYQTVTRYQGIFMNGFLNGDGLKFNAGKYSFGRFQNGTLVEHIYLEERSLASEEKLKQLKKINHLRSLNFTNSYLPEKFIGFKGLSEIIFQITLKQQFIHQKIYDIISPISKKNNNFASRIFYKEDSGQKSVYSISQDELSNSDIGKGYSGVNSLRKFRI